MYVRVVQQRNFQNFWKFATGLNSFAFQNSSCCPIEKVLRLNLNLTANFQRAVLIQQKMNNKQFALLYSMMDLIASCLRRQEFLRNNLQLTSSVLSNLQFELLQVCRVSYSKFIYSTRAKLVYQILYCEQCVCFGFKQATNNGIPQFLELLHLLFLWLVSEKLIYTQPTYSTSEVSKTYDFVIDLMHYNVKRPFNALKIRESDESETSGFLTHI